MTTTRAGLEFNEAAHEYTLDGSSVISVTTVLRDAGVVDFSYCSEFYRDRGSKAHKAVWLDTRGKLSFMALDESLVGYVMAARKFLSEMDAVTDAAEERVFSRAHQYAGTIDWRGTVRGMGAIVDWKTGFNPPASAKLQLGGYAGAVAEMTGRTPRKLFVVGLHPDGEYRICHEAERRDIERFNHCLTVARLRRELRMTNE